MDSDSGLDLGLDLRLVSDTTLTGNVAGTMTGTPQEQEQEQELVPNVGPGLPKTETETAETDSEPLRVKPLHVPVIALALPQHDLDRDAVASLTLPQSQSLTHSQTKQARHSNSHSLSHTHNHSHDTVKLSANPRVKKKLRVDAGVTMETLLDGWTQCCFFLPRKQRLCNIARSLGSLYCGAHMPAQSQPQPHSQSTSSNSLPQSEAFAAESTVTVENRMVRKMKARLMKERVTGEEAGTDIAGPLADGVALEALTERVPCPLDPTHSVFRHRLTAHLRICNVTLDLQRLASKAYFRKDVNAVHSMNENASDLCLPCDTEPFDATAFAETLQNIFENHVLAEIRDARNTFQYECSSHVPAGEATARETSSLATNSDDKALAAAIEEALTVGGAQTAFSKTRHVLQDVALVCEMRANGLLSIESSSNGPNLCPSDHGSGRTERTGNLEIPAKPAVEPGLLMVELGAGRAMLGWSMSIACPDAALLLVERSGVRRKADRQLRATAHRFARIRMDLRHCYLPNLHTAIRHSDHSNVAMQPQPVQLEHTMDVAGQANEMMANASDECELRQPLKIVFAAKHLCGMASDLALRGLREFSCNHSASNTAAPVSGSVGQMTSVNFRSDANAKPPIGVAIATCCHHRCIWEELLANEWLQSLGIRKREFEVLKAWSGWAALKDTDTESASDSKVNDTIENYKRDVDVDVETEAEMDTAEGLVSARQAPRPPHVTPAAMRRLGFMAKRVLDQCRVRFLRQLGLDAWQVRYCDEGLSPECFAIVAHSSASV